jgi:hypothetical protein
VLFVLVAAGLAGLTWAWLRRPARRRRRGPRAAAGREAAALGLGPALSAATERR